MFTVAKPNIGVPRVFKTREGLERALRRAGAEKISWGNDHVIVGWPPEDKSDTTSPAVQVTYAIDKDGNVDHQLAWDMEA